MGGAGGSGPGFAEAARLADAVRAAVLRAADPTEAVERCWPREELEGTRVRLLAVGKAAVPMARRALALLGSVTSGALVVTTPHPEAGSLGVETVVADHPLATERNLAASARVEAFVGGTSGDEVLVVLLSGGGSALLTAPAEGLGLEDLRGVTGLLLRAGAPIRELNCVRKHCERLKGGRLARLVGGGARVIALVVSDVLGDPLDVVSSGPLSADPTTYAGALAVLEGRGLVGVEAAGRVVAHLRRGVAGEIEETPKAGDAALGRVRARVIAGNQGVAVGARDALLGLGFERVKVVCRVEGEAAEVGRMLVREGASFAEEGGGSGGRAGGGPRAVVYAGETTVTVGQAAGVGGRNQELGLSAAVEMRGARRMCVLTLATDGVDGPTDAAGAVVTSETAGRARERGIDLPGALARHDSHTALGALGCLVRTGPTGTNVNDVAVAMVW